MEIVFLCFCLQIICYEAFDAVIGPNVPRGFKGHAIGYDYDNETVLIFGSWWTQFPQQFIQFDPTTTQFTDMGENYLTPELKIYGTGQYYSQHGKILWIIARDGVSLYTINTETYTEHDPTIAIPVTVSYKSCLATIPTQNYLFVIGGENGATLDLVQGYNISSGMWFNAPSLQIPRKTLACLGIGNELYAIGGKNDDMAVAFNSIETLTFSQPQNNWSFITGTLATELASLTAVPYGDNIVVIGGMPYSNTHVAYIHMIDTETGNVEVVGSLASATGQTACVIVHGILHVFAGFPEQNVYQYAVLPTAHPTQNPFRYPSSQPTPNPSRLPSSQPTQHPTQVTQQPTGHPTEAPLTNYPTMDPTTNPILTADPSNNPTKDPIYFISSSSSSTVEPSSNPSRLSQSEASDVMTSEADEKRDNTQISPPNPENDGFDLVTRILLYAIGTLCICVIFALMCFYHKHQTVTSAQTKNLEIFDEHNATSKEHGTKGNEAVEEERNDTAQLANVEVTSGAIICDVAVLNQESVDMQQRNFIEDSEDEPKSFSEGPKMMDAIAMVDDIAMITTTTKGEVETDNLDTEVIVNTNIDDDEFIVCGDDEEIITETKGSNELRGNCVDCGCWKNGKTFDGMFYCNQCYDNYMDN